MDERHITSRDGVDRDRVVGEKGWWKGRRSIPTIRQRTLSQTPTGFTGEVFRSCRASGGREEPRVTRPPLPSPGIRPSPRRK